MRSGAVCREYHEQAIAKKSREIAALRAERDRLQRIVSFVEDCVRSGKPVPVTYLTSTEES